MLESQSMDIERFSDWGKPKNTSKRNSLNQILQLQSHNFPKELIGGSQLKQFMQILTWYSKKYVLYFSFYLSLPLLVSLIEYWNFRFKESAAECQKDAMESRLRFDKKTCLILVCFSVFIIYLLHRVIYSKWIPLMNIIFWVCIFQRNFQLFHVYMIHWVLPILKVLL